MFKSLFKPKFIIGSLALMSVSGGATAQEFEWVKGMGGSDPDWGHATAVDGANNIYVTGFFKGSATFPFAGDTLYSNGGNDIFLVKMDPAGNVIWQKGLGGTGDDVGNSIAIDPTSGDVILAGTFAGTVDFNPGGTNGSVTSAGSNDVFFARFDSSGNFIWVKSVGGSGVEDVKSVTVDLGGNTYIAGDFKSVTAYFNPGVAGSGELTVTGSTSKPNPDGFLAKYDRNGDFVWIHKIAGTASEYCGQVKTDADKNVYLIGWFSSTNTQFDSVGNANTLLTTRGGYDIFLAKYDSTGKLLWNQRMGGKTADHGMGLAIDAAGDLYITGYFDSDTAEFNPAAPSAASMIRKSSSIDIYIAKYRSNGDFVWVKSMEGDKQDHAQGIALDGASNIYITGATESSYVNFNPGGGGGTIINIASYGIFLAKFNKDGDFISARGMGGIQGQDWGRSVAVDGHGNVYVTGYFSSHIADFNRGNVGGLLEGYPSNYDVYLLKLACNQASEQTLNVTACESFTFDGQDYVQPGNYELRYVSTAGCDSVVHLNLSFYDIIPTILPIENTLYVRESFASYQWIKNGNDIDGATDSFYVVTDNADYQVRVTKESIDCDFISAVYTVNNVGIHSTSVMEDQIRIYPNPARGTLHIQSPMAVNTQVLALDGRLVRAFEQKGTIDLSGIPSGVYVLRVLDQSHQLIKTEKLIVE